MAVTATDPIKIIFAVLLPPVGTFLEVGLTGHFWLNIVLTLLGYVPRHRACLVRDFEALTLPKRAKVFRRGVARRL